MAISLVFITVMLSLAIATAVSYWFSFCIQRRIPMRFSIIPPVVLILVIFYFVSLDQETIASLYSAFLEFLKKFLAR